MDIRKLNELLATYKIEIICDNCQKDTEYNLKTPASKSIKKEENVILQSEKKTSQKICKTAKNQNDSKKIKLNLFRETATHTQSKPKRKEYNLPNDPFASAQKSKCLIRTNFLFNPPNDILNSNYHQTEGGRKFNIQELLDSHRNTPNKIEDVDVERFYFSEKKENHFKNNLTNSTMQPMLMCPEESPISSRNRRKTQTLESCYYDKLALVGIPSRDASPIQTSYHRNQDTPSYRDRTPRQPIMFTPIMRGQDNLDECNNEQFNLLQNPFGEQF